MIKHNTRLKQCEELVRLPEAICTARRETLSGDSKGKLIPQFVTRSTWHNMQHYIPKGERIAKAKK